MLQVWTLEAANMITNVPFPAPGIAADTGLRLRPVQYERKARPGAQMF